MPLKLFHIHPIQEILKFFESHEHASHEQHHSHGAAGELSLGSGPLASSIELAKSHEHESNEHLHDHEPEHEPPLHDHSVHDHPLHSDHSVHDHPLHPHPLHNHQIHDRPALDPIVHHPNPHPYNWQHPYPIENPYKKTDAVELNNKPLEAQRLMRALTAKRNPYTYFNIKTGEPVKTENNRARRSVHELEIHAELHDDHPHSDEIPHSTTASFKDKRIAGVSQHIYKQHIFKNRAHVLTK